MVFSTIIFLCVFLPITIIGYYLMPGQWKNGFLLLASLLFYAWGEPSYVWIMLLSIVCNYVFGRAIAAAAHKKLWLVLAVLTNLGILGIFKYAGFVLSNLSRIFPGVLSIPEIALPIGISFYTFQGLSYCIDVYRDREIVQKNPFHLALYISMFPQLIAGPIVRYGDVQKSLTQRSHSPELFAQGAERFIIGLSKKAILANSMGELAEQIMGSNMDTMSSPVAWLGAIAYTLQIYFDFSGYSDMAIGLGSIFGFHFPENFRYPYISKSIREFWRRWHISLSTWFKDYLYIPLGGNRKGNVYLHLFLVFLATGLWHGAAWGFVIWGLWHGLFSILERIIGNVAGKKNPESEEKQKNNRWGRLLKCCKALAAHGYTMLVVIVGWVLFKLVDVKETLHYLKVMFGLSNHSFIAYHVNYYMTGRMTTLFVIALLACMPWGQITGLQGDKRMQTLPVIVLKRIGLFLLLAVSFIFIITGTYNPFIYFRF
jgi:alginate O-acetyltransferase complex protein AlgI